MHPVLETIYQTGYVQDAKGETHKLNSHVDVAKGEFLQKIIREHKPQRSLEIGLAYGISTLFICEALQEQPEACHMVIDPVQSTYWRGVGLENLRRAGYDPLIKFQEKSSQQALPEFENEKLKFDFAFIDGWHLYDFVLFDFFFIDRMLKTGGIIVFDDASWPSIRKVLRFIARNRNYTLYDYVSQQPEEKRKRSSLEKISRPFPSLLVKFAKMYAKTKHFKGDSYVHFLRDITLAGYFPGSDFVAIRKTATDRRPYDHFGAF